MEIHQPKSFKTKMRGNKLVRGIKAKGHCNIRDGYDGK
jgi:hypothetical protein